MGNVSAHIVASHILVVSNIVVCPYLLQVLCILAEESASPVIEDMVKSFLVVDYWGTPKNPFRLLLTVRGVCIPDTHNSFDSVRCVRLLVCSRRFQQKVGLHVVTCHEYTSNINKILCSIILKIGAMQAISLYRYHKLMASVYIIMYRAYSLMDI